ncbi:MAG: Fe-S oxidoreductase [candidate division Zixibacteria bacterium]|nr:Fe-S oxidoreductase [candidate division Zixibacteria bacterium]
MRILLVEPSFPIPPKSKNHRDFLPVGLLKLASFHRERGDEIKLVRGNQQFPDFYPNQVKITSLFTYWSNYVWESAKFYKENYPKARVIVGGIYASLMPEHCKKSGCDEVFIGVDEKAEKFKPAYDLVNVDYQIVHTSRGCLRRCKFCGTWKIEPEFKYKKSIKDEIRSNRVIFYDNNLLANPYIKDILEELKNSKHNGRVVYSESQCGIDGRLLTPEVAKLIKEARFLNPRIAWDHRYDQRKMIKKQIDMLVEAGYPAKDIYVFMIYNYNQDYYEMLKKLRQCKRWGVQIADCRYRPLNQTFEHYNPRARQTNKDYYIHPEWTDRQIKLFRKKVRRQNITIRHGFDIYNYELEREGARIREKRLLSTQE